MQRGTGRSPRPPSAHSARRQFVPKTRCGSAVICLRPATTPSNDSGVPACRSSCERAEKKKPATIPPETRENAARDVGDHIAGIARRPAYKVRADHLEQNGPDNQLKRDLSGGWHFVLPAQLHPALDLQ